MKMSSKKVHVEPQKEPVPGESAQPSREAGLDASQPAQADLEKQLTEAQSRTAEYKDGWQRSVAEFQNYRRRVEAGNAETYRMAVGNVIKRYLPVLDDMERAIESRPADLPWADGVELIYRKLLSILEAEGVMRMEAEGQKFDPNFHEAIAQEPVEGVECGTVIAVIRNGYMLGDQVIRPAMVRVAQ
jgi:molecular chaperone GrpE